MSEERSVKTTKATWTGKTEMTPVHGHIADIHPETHLGKIGRAFLIVGVSRFYGVDCSLLPDQELIAMHLAIPKTPPEADTPTIVEGK